MNDENVFLGQLIILTQDGPYAAAEIKYARVEKPKT